MTSWMLVVFALAIGFAFSGFVTSVHAMVFKQESGVLLPLNGMPGVAWSFFVCMFAGPFLLSIFAYRYWRTVQIPGSIFSLCCFLSVCWSFCSGVVLVQTLNLIGVI